MLKFYKFLSLFLFQYLMYGSLFSRIHLMFLQILEDLMLFLTVSG
jgi:hypothetical protein